MDDKHETVKLSFTIYKYSSYSGPCVPDNILIDDSSNEISRWFTDNTDPDQYLMLKLKSPAIVETIGFGKYMKAHVSDLKSFKILGGMEENNLTLLLKEGLKNDNQTEVFPLKHHTAEGFPIPIKYIKIIPVQSWGPPNNFTIWYVSLTGKNQEELINSSIQALCLRKEEEAIRLVLKHLRHRHYTAAYDALTRESGISLEGPVQDKLWNVLVEDGDYEKAERLFEEAVKDGELSWYMSWQPYTPRWRLVSPCSSAVEEKLCRPSDYVFVNYAPVSDVTCSDREWMSGANDGTESPVWADDWSCKPGPRGGHQLVMDSAANTLYLFGGWNGTADLDDLWSYDIAADRWTLLFLHSELVGGPSPRSCHKMVLDPVEKKLYTLGRYLDPHLRQNCILTSDFFVYDIAAGEWRQLCKDTEAAGGPRLMFDHQMCIDTVMHSIYVFGGRLLPSPIVNVNDETTKPSYSGMFVYHIESGTWEMLMDDRDDPKYPVARVGHSMLFHPVRRRLYIFAGQRNKEMLLDMWWWDVDSGKCGALASHNTRTPPVSGFTQRATLDPDTDEMFVLSGMSKEKDRCVSNTMWVFSFSRATWYCVYRNEIASSADPRPRFAHQLVYDPARKMHYLFGGNPGSQSSPRLRLDDLWSLHLEKPSLAGVAARARATLREARYVQLASGADPERAVRALDYLRRDVYASLDHSDPLQVQHFQKLATVLFAEPPSPQRVPRALSPRVAKSLAVKKACAVRRVDGVELSKYLTSVLGAEDYFPDRPLPVEIPELEREKWDMNDDDELHQSEAWEARAARITIYDTLCQYFRPSAVPPDGELLDLVTI